MSASPHSSLAWRSLAPSNIGTSRARFGSCISLTTTPRNRTSTSSSPSCQFPPPAHHDTKWTVLMYEPIKSTHTLCSLRDPPPPSTLRPPELQPPKDLLSTALTADLPESNTGYQLLPTVTRRQLPSIGCQQGLGAADGLAELRCDGEQRRGLQRRRGGNQ